MALEGVWKDIPAEEIALMKKVIEEGRQTESPRIRILPTSAYK
ncbi:MAG: hypothetical protein AABX47_04025 [Nanoarchaeota archaeon]